MTTEIPCIALSSGEPAGIGPDICALLATRALRWRIGVLGDPAVLDARARQLRLPIRVLVRATPAEVEPEQRGVLQVLAVEAAQPVVPGRLDPGNADYVLRILRRGVDICRRGEAAALVTAPVQKSVINAAGVQFTGHTEFLAELTGAAQPVMMLAGGQLRVALATTHLPLRAVADAIDQELLERVITVVDTDLRKLFALAAPRILVLGLNPHAGESGVLGDEERTVIAPAVARMRARGLAVHGPVSADTAFTAESLAGCDVVLAMYHDQGLPVIKAVGFGEIVNVTLGLPIIRTSVDHGTALSLAGTGKARAESLCAAVELAGALARRAAGR
jgi:4-hydroxythreonine-4-phosphate dehydrogenase